MLGLKDTVLVMIDMQGKLWNAMSEKETLLDNAQKLLRGMLVMGVPIILTEQNPAGLGPTLPELTQLIPEIKAVSKYDFNCCRVEAFRQSMLNLKRSQVLLCGIEAHICVYQTALGLLDSGRQVQVVADVVSSRVTRNRDIALERMQSEGVGLTACEMALYELMETAESPKFKEMLKVIK